MQDQPAVGAMATDATDAGSTEIVTLPPALRDRCYRHPQDPQIYVEIARHYATHLGTERGTNWETECEADRGTDLETGFGTGLEIGLGTDLGSGLGKNRGEAARRAWERAIALNPQDADVHRGLAQLMVKQQAPYDPVIIHYLAALARTPEDYTLYREMLDWAQTHGHRMEAMDFGNFRLPVRWLLHLAQQLGQRDRLEVWSDRPSGRFGCLQGASLYFAPAQQAIVVRSPRETLIGDFSDGNLAYFLTQDLAAIPPVDQVCSGNVLSLVTRWSEDNYFHWIVDTLPRLLALEAAKLEVSQIDHVLVSSLRHAYQRESLALFGIDLARVIACDRTPHVQTERLFISRIDSRAVTYDFLRDRLLPAARPHFPTHLPTPERLYISRQGASRRRLRNEDVIIAQLQTAGFTAVSLEGRSFVEQIGLMSAARIVVAPHGAGLTNLVFCPPQTTVIELFPDSYHEYSYETLCYVLAFNYHTLIGTSTGAPNHDFVIDPDSLQALLSAELATLAPV